MEVIKTAKNESIVWLSTYFGKVLFWDIILKN